jgi:hypothetical protein
VGRRAPITRSGVIAGVSFGFWVALFDRTYEDLWRERLHRAFPYAALSRREVGAVLRRVHQLRNRIAHHDCLLDKDVAQQAAEIATLATWVDPEAAVVLQRAAGVERVLARRP